MKIVNGCTCNQKNNNFSQSNWLYAIPFYNYTRLLLCIVLITGGAGFIGFHIGIKLAENKKNSIVALDIFDDSYNVHLKKVRADILNSQGKLTCI